MEIRVRARRRVSPKCNEAEYHEKHPPRLHLYFISCLERYSLTLCTWVLRLTRTCIFPDNGTLSKMSPLWPKLRPQVPNNNQSSSLCYNFSKLIPRDLYPLFSHCCLLSLVWSLLFVHRPPNPQTWLGLERRDCKHASVASRIYPSPRPTTAFEARFLARSVLYSYEWQLPYAYPSRLMTCSATWQPVAGRLWRVFPMPPTHPIEPSPTVTSGPGHLRMSSSKRMNLHRRDRWWRS